MTISVAGALEKNGYTTHFIWSPSQPGMRKESSQLEELKATAVLPYISEENFGCGGDQFSLMEKVNDSVLMGDRALVV